MITLTVVNYLINFVQIFNGWGHYNCLIEYRDGKEGFHFKKQWYYIDDLITENTRILRSK